MALGEWMEKRAARLTIDICHGEFRAVLTLIHKGETRCAVHVETAPEPVQAITRVLHKAYAHEDPSRSPAV